MSVRASSFRRLCPGRAGGGVRPGAELLLPLPGGYSRDLITKRAGAGYETDAEFYGSDGSIYLHVEAKASGQQTDKLARQVREYGELSDMPIAATKEIE